MSTAPSDACSAVPSGRVLGLKPWFPWPLSRWQWLTAPVRAERLAALRIGLALVMLVDVLTTYLPRSGDYLSRDSLGSRELFAHELNAENNWALLHNRLVDKVDDPTDMRLLMVVWVAFSVLLLVGLFSRVSALAAWAISGSVALFNSSVDNAGDMIRTLTLFYLIISPCGGVWAVDAWIRRRYRWSFGDAGRETVGLHRRDMPLREPFYIYPWALCLLFVQMMLIYACNGLYKAGGDTWHDGSSLHYVLGDLTLARFSYAMLPLPYRLTQWMTWSVLWWELLVAPVMLVPWRTLADLVQRVRWGGLHHLHVLLRWNRAIFLIFGVLFHVGILLGMEIGGFAPYMLCLYLPLVPWERWRRRAARESWKTEPPPVQQRQDKPASLEVFSAAHPG
jgi:hypothetical protein